MVLGTVPVKATLMTIGDNQQQKDSRQFYLVVPAPTSVHAPPPPIATRMNLVTDPPETTPTVPSTPAEKAAPGEDCGSACRSAFSSCNLACDPAAKGAACKSCDPDYKKCMQRCFE